MEDTATFRIGNNKYELPVKQGTEGEIAVDTSHLRARSGAITLDEGYGNTGCCESKITFIDGEAGILRYRGYPIEQLAEHSNFLETAWLLLYGELPSQTEFKPFEKRILREAAVNDNLYGLLRGFPRDSQPMALLSTLVQGLGCYFPELNYPLNREKFLENFDENAIILISQIRTLAAAIYRFKQGKAINAPDARLSYVGNFLHMMFSSQQDSYQLPETICRALDLILILHADHEQNCSTSTMRMVGSSGTHVFSCLSASINALWGPLHGGANTAVLEMLSEIEASGDNGNIFIEEAKAGKRRLVGFGHRVYKNYDPRAKILGQATAEVLRCLNTQDKLLSIAQRLEEKALQDPYFIDRKLYPNVDFYSGILLKAMGIPKDLFTVIFALGRLPGWLAHYRELLKNPPKIARPRQIYQGAKLRNHPNHP